MVVGDELASRTTSCPACGTVLRVPVPMGKAPLPTDVTVQCPHCKHQNAPGTETCRKCGTDIESGKRPSLTGRLALISWQRWAISAGALIALLIAAVMVTSLYDSHRRAHEYSPPGAGVATAPPVPLDELAAALLASEDLAARRAVYAELVELGAQCIPAVAAALDDSLQTSTSAAARTQNQLVAIEFLAAHAHHADNDQVTWLAVLERCQHDNELADAATAARALLGDRDVAGDLAGLWEESLRRQTFLERALRAAKASQDAGAQAALADAQRDVERYARAIQRLARQDSNGVLAPLAEDYWPSWSWLGQQRGEAYAKALFTLAQPFRPGRASVVARDEAETVENIRAARRALDRLATAQSPLAVAAAGIALVSGAPQYQSARDRIEGVLAGQFAECTPRDQQRLTWALARITGRRFGDYSDDRQPFEVGSAEVRAVFGWMRERGFAEGAEDYRPRRYPARTELSYETVPARRVLENELLQEFARGWESAGPAIDRWRDARLGFTDRVRAALDPTQRNPNSSLLAAAMVIVADNQARSARRALELWQHAPDQPAWVRSMAHTVLGALDAPGPTWPSGWPASLENAAFVELATQAPEWDYFGRVLAAGGEPMIQRLRDYQPAPLSSEWRERLIRAAHQAGSD